MEELRFANEAIELVVLPEVGARLHRLRAFGEDLLRTPDDPAEHRRDPFFWGAYVMAPWCNRIEAGPVVVASRTVALGSNFPDGSAIHGQVYARPWDVLEDRSLRVRGGGDGWPWRYEVGLRIALDDRAVRIEQTLTNLSDDGMPAGLGLHPWFRRPVTVAIRGNAVYPSNASPAPKPAPEPVHGPFNLRSPTVMADDLDATWSDLAEPPVMLEWRDTGINLTMRIDAPTVHVVSASPADLDAIAVEPQTHAPQGLRRLLRGEPGALTMLQSGNTLALGVTIELELERHAGILKGRLRRGLR